MYSISILFFSVPSSPVRMNETTTVVTRLTTSSRIQAPNYSTDLPHYLNNNINNSIFKLVVIALAAALLAIAMVIILMWKLRRPKNQRSGSVESYTSISKRPLPDRPFPSIKIDGIYEELDQYRTYTGGPGGGPFEFHTADPVVDPSLHHSTLL